MGFLSHREIEEEVLCDLLSCESVLGDQVTPSLQCPTLLAIPVLSLSAFQT